MYIESPQNNRVRAWSQLKTKKGRTRQGLFLVEGRRLVEELLTSAYEIDALLWNVASDEPSDELRNHSKVAAHFFELSPAAFDLVSDTTTPQGLIAVAKIPTTTSLTSAPMADHAVLLDGIQDPGNVGTLLRTCEGFGFLSVCCGNHTVDPFSPKVVRSTMGGMFRLNLHTGDSLSFIESWRTSHSDGRVVVSTADADKLCYRAPLAGATLIVVGSEAFGASEEVRSQADLTVAIPMQADTESLNAAVAGSILLYETYRQRHGSDGSL